MKQEQHENVITDVRTLDRCIRFLDLFSGNYVAVDPESGWIATARNEADIDRTMLLHVLRDKGDPSRFG